MDNSPLPAINPTKSNEEVIIPANVEPNNATEVPSVNNKKKSGKPELLIVDANLLQQFFQQLPRSQEIALNSENSLAKTAFIKEYVTPLNNKHQTAFTAVLKQSLTSQLIQQLQNKDQALRTFSNSIFVFVDLMKNFKECSVTFPIIQATYAEFQHLWIEAQRHLGNEIIQKQLMKIWKFVPYQLLKSFLLQFQLIESYHSIPVPEFLKWLTGSLFESKIQQSCEYYRLFKLNNKQIENETATIEKFEAEQIIPRIAKKDQLFTDYVLSFLKEDASISEQVFAVIDDKQYEKLLNMTGKDIRQHKKIFHAVIKKHYKDIRRRFKDWYIVEDKISFSSIFVEWYAADFLKKAKNIPLSDDSDGQKTAEQTISYEQAQKIANSMLFRAGLLPELTHQQIKNPLYERDDYIPAEFIIQNIKGLDNLKRQDYYIIENPEKIHIIDKINQSFYDAQKLVLSADVVGFDSQFWATSNKYEEGGVSIIQLATKSDLFIFDYRSLRKNEEFDHFFIKLMENGHIVKVGHTVASDLQFLYQTFSQKMKIANLIDLTHIFKTHFPNEVYSSLAYMTEKLLGKKMCKYEQRSNWNRRPLKKMQIHYAVLDALVCVEIYDKLKLMGGNKEKKVHVKIQRQISAQEKAVEEGKLKKGEVEFDFQRFKDYLENPIFLIDNMLKKLCKTMRNCGLDTEYIAVKDHDLAVSQAKKEKRILVTRDNKLMLKRYSHVPIYLLNERSDTDRMFIQLQQVFSLNLEDYHTLSRCVKCNNSELLKIPAEEAKAEVNFTHPDSVITQFWRCSRCKQIYWEGGQFMKAKNKFDALRK